MPGQAATAKEPSGREGVTWADGGLTLWYGGADTPAPAGDQPRQGTALVVGVAPALPFNTVTVHYQIDDGPIRQIPAGELVQHRRADEQRFRATFPTLPAGCTVAYQPVLTSAGRQLPAPGSGPTRAAPAASWSRFRVASPPESTRAVPAAPASLPVEHLARCEVALAPPEIIGATPDGLKVNWWVTSGQFAGPRLRGKFRAEGADWMTIRPDGVAIIDVRATLQTDDGALIACAYGGVFDLGPDGMRNFLAGKYPAAPLVRGAPRYVTADDRYAWLNRLQCVVAGQVDMAAGRVVYDLYALR